MKLMQLRYFVETVKFNSITKASKELFVTQPSITNAIKELENEFNTILFIRNNNILTITEDGKYLYNLALSLLNHSERVIKDMNNFVRRKESIKIGIPPMLGTFLIPPIIDRFAKLYPNIEIDILELGSNENQNKVIENEIDFAFTVIYNNEYNPNLNYYKLGSTKLMLAVNKNNILKDEKIVSFEQIKDIPLILMKDDTLQARIVKNEFNSRNIIPNIRIRSNQVYTIRELLYQPQYAAFIFDRIFNYGSDLIKIDLDKNINFDIVIGWNKKTELNDMAKEFIEFLINNKIYV